MNKQPGFVGIAVLIAVVISVATGGYFVYQNRIQKFQQLQPQTSVTSTQDIEVSEKTSKDSSNLNIKLDAQVLTTESCSEEKCFNQKFATCEKASMTKEISLIFGSTKYHYEILGPRAGGCEMMTLYLESPETSWENKEMFCLYDNKLKLELASEKVMKGIADGSVKCNGPLFEILKESLGE